MSARWSPERGWERQYVVKYQKWWRLPGGDTVWAETTVWLESATKAVGLPLEDSFVGAEYQVSVAATGEVVGTGRTVPPSP